jgi:peptide/nickel transport system ATP-binding protein
MYLLITFLSYTRMLPDAVPKMRRGAVGRAAIAGEVPNQVEPPSGCGFHPRGPLALSRGAARTG